MRINFLCTNHETNVNNAVISIPKKTGAKMEFSRTTIKVMAIDKSATAVEIIPSIFYLSIFISFALKVLRFSDITGNPNSGICHMAIISLFLSNLQAD